jgi:hypothetical protein
MFGRRRWCMGGQYVSRTCLPAFATGAPTLQNILVQAQSGRHLVLVFHAAHRATPQSGFGQGLAFLGIDGQPANLPLPTAQVGLG